jgi:hypothetical protein
MVKPELQIEINSKIISSLHLKSCLYLYHLKSPVPHCFLYLNSKLVGGLLFSVGGLCKRC